MLEVFDFLLAVEEELLPASIGPLPLQFFPYNHHFSQHGSLEPTENHL